METLASTSDWAAHAATVVGTVAFAVSGTAAARRAAMDWLGGLVLAVIVAVGGGTIRDVLVDRPVFWLDEPWPLAVAGATGVAVMIARARFGVDPAGWRTIVVADAVGLAVFTVVGTDVAVDAGVSPAGAMILGVVTGTGGGILRDVLANEKPLVLVAEIYALAALAGAALHVGLLELGLDPVATWWAPVMVILALRLVAIRRGWSLPRLDRGT